MPAAKKSRAKSSGSKSPRTPSSSATKSLKIPGPCDVELTPPKRLSNRSLTVATGAPPPVETVVYIHGIGNKPVASILKAQWDYALFNAEMGDRTRLSYWVNRDYYPEPEIASAMSGDLAKVDDDEMPTRSVLALAGEKPADEERAIELEIDSLAENAAQKNFLRSIAATMVASTPQNRSEAGAIRAAGVRAKIIPFLPPAVSRWITRKLTRAFLRDVNDFFFNETKRAEMRRSLIDRLEAGGGPFVVIAHSQGTMIAYDVLRQLTKDKCDVRLFVTMGSPLGVKEVQDVFKGWTGGPMRVPECVSKWVNVADRFAPVSADTNLSNDFEGTPKIINFRGAGLNLDSLRHPHSATGYLKTVEVKDAVREAVGNAFTQIIARSVIAKDLVEEMEDSERDDRHSALIQLSSRTGQPQDLDQLRATLEKHITKLVQDNGKSIGEAQLDHMKRFIACKLTRLEIEKLRTEFDDLCIERIWKDAAKRAYMYQSTHVIQALPASIGYGAAGQGITWAVLDTGITCSHPHFRLYGNVQRQWDCTGSGAPKEVGPDDIDGNGHGTHVAGIIAGKYPNELELRPKEPPVSFAGMAPKTTIYDFKVLDDRGNGSDSSIIKALDLIADLNDRSGGLVIQGVNLSLGGNFDPSVYGCGHTPLCQELRRLWNQGVIVVLAAGNEGYAMLQAQTGEVPTNLDLSIADPANLEEAIAVGSIHKHNPHTYGVSFFSSRGPTADGRQKPDLVAPGEQILSANNSYTRRSGEYQKAEDLYIEMSGTSMAAPHVSGILAAFLSMRREFIGFPDKVRQALLDNCTDLGRDRYIQGRGMPNLIKMLANT